MDERNNNNGRKGKKSPPNVCGISIGNTVPPVVFMAAACSRRQYGAIDIGSRQFVVLAGHQIDKSLMNPNAQF